MLSWFCRKRAPAARYECWPDGWQPGDVEWVPPKDVEEHAVVDLRIAMPPAWQQGATRASAAFAAVFLYWFWRRTVHGDIDVALPSLLDTYARARSVFGVEDRDVGASLRACFEAWSGAPPGSGRACALESSFQFDPVRVCQAPPRAYQELSPVFVGSPQRVAHADMQALLLQGTPAAAALYFYDDIVLDNNAVLEWPTPEPRAPVCSVAVVFVGYDTRAQLYALRFSRGRAWAQDGHAYLRFTDFAHPGRVGTAWCLCK